MRIASISLARSRIKYIEDPPLPSPFPSNLLHSYLLFPFTHIFGPHSLSFYLPYFPKTLTFFSYPPYFQDSHFLFLPSLLPKTPTFFSYRPYFPTALIFLSSFPFVIYALFICLHTQILQFSNSSISRKVSGNVWYRWAATLYLTSKHAAFPCGTKIPICTVLHRANISHPALITSQYRLQSLQCPINPKSARLKKRSASALFRATWVPNHPRAPVPATVTLSPLPRMTLYARIKVRFFMSYLQP